MISRLNFVQQLKRKIFIIMCLVYTGANSQCPPNDYLYAIAQEDIDNFIIDYPNCTELQTLLIGDVINSTVTNLDGLINLISINWLQLTNTPINNLQGLNNVTFIDSFVIYYTPTLLSLSGLDNLTSVGDLRIDFNPNLLNLQGLENVTSINLGLRIIENEVLEDLSQLQNLESVGGNFTVNDCPAISSFTGFENLELVGGDLTINECLGISNFTGLENLESIGGGFTLSECPIISSFMGLENLISIEGDTFFVDNNNNLNNSSGLNCFFFSEGFRNNINNYTLQSSLYQSVFDNCGIVILSNESFDKNNYIIYPNPTKNIIRIDSAEPINRIDIFDTFGRLVKYKVSDLENVDISELSTGSYILQIKFDSGIIRKEKFIVE